MVLNENLFYLKIDFIIFPGTAIISGEERDCMSLIEYGNSRDEMTEHEVEITGIMHSF